MLLNCGCKFYRSFSFFLMTRNFLSKGSSRSSISSFHFDGLTFSKNIRKLAYSLMHCDDRKHFCNLLGFIIWHVNKQGRSRLRVCKEVMPPPSPTSVSKVIDHEWIPFFGSTRETKHKYGFLVTSGCLLSRKVWWIVRSVAFAQN